MKENQIESLMLTAMESMRNMIDVNTIIGEPATFDKTTIIPISKLGFGLASGGSEFKNETPQSYLKKQQTEEMIQYKLPFGGGAGLGASLTPIAFIVIQDNSVKLLPRDHKGPLDKFLDYTPDLIDKIEKCLEKFKERC